MTGFWKTHHTFDIIYISVHFRPPGLMYYWFIKWLNQLHTTSIIGYILEIIYVLVTVEMLKHETLFISHMTPWSVFQNTVKNNVHVCMCIIYCRGYCYYQSSVILQ